MLVQLEDYNRMGRIALERAQKARGVRSAEAFAKLLAARTGGYPSSSTYHRWLRGESPIPLWIVLVAAEEAEQSLDSLLAEGQLPESVGERLGQLEELIGVLQAQMIEVRERLDLPWQSERAEEPATRPPRRRRATS